ncbi:AAA family ATPase [Candidatus Binatia bacterium]|nr:AAA family ATPase [Microbacteriaceae bacterium]MBY0280444.1 AAA family ATPase [Candidatus Binatia bacterium]
MLYEFFHFPDEDAAIAIQADGPRVAIHLASQGSTTAGRLRNPGRPRAFQRLMEGISGSLGAATVIAARHGRMDTPTTLVNKRFDAGGREAVEEAARAGGNFRLDFWLELPSVSSASQVAADVGLEPFEHSPVAVVWPDSAPPMVQEIEAEAFRERFDAEVSAIDRPSSGDSTKWKRVESLVAQSLQLDPADVAVWYVSTANNIWNRVRQRGRRIHLRILLAPTPNMAGASQKLFEDVANGKHELDGAVAAVATQTSDGWRIVAVYALERPTAGDAIRLADLAGVERPEEAEREEGLASNLHVPGEWLREVLWLLDDKRGVVFYGPPGTGKTFIAQQIARHLQPNDVLRTLVQLHPSYGYEEFFEGYRPDVGSDDGASSGPRLRKYPGPLRLLVKEIADRGQRGVLILDEMNRGNLPRIFGELYFLLEYRDREVRLMYSPTESFRLPDDLYIIGTMNTADRSVALLDQALRRRFHFVPLFPTEEPVRGMLRSYLKRAYPRRELDGLADALEAANSKLDRNVTIGPSHFMRPDLDRQRVHAIWKHSVMPSIEEHHFGQAILATDFDLDTLWPRKRPDALDDDSSAG